jgi:hypothetical protein
MPRQVTDEEFNFLQQRRQVADFVESIYNDPQLNKEAKALIKKKYPQMQIPDYDIENRVEQQLQKDRDERAAEKQAARDAEDKRRFEETRAATQKKYGFTDEGMQKLEKMMLERNVGDYDVAAQYVASTQPKTSDPTYDSSRWHHERAPNFAEIAKDPEAWGRNEIETSLREIEERQRNQRF